MKLHNTLQNEAIVSNVGEIGEFRIRNSAKAFNILSSGLYANKIRAIIRELSCNAVDSHTAAGKADVPFDVHLPNAIEPWFSIRDYGTGLSGDQVTNIYTTYFESTKTGSNDFIGALGLGSKSPFSYTDNFTVTAVQNGRKGIYTAFINEQGVPSIALMMEEETTDPNGVEVRFAVEESYDFRKFRDEAARVYTHFKLRPVVSGYNDFKFIEVEYTERDIIPGVHSCSERNGSVAIMGNIAYPIDIPNSDQSLGELSRLLDNGNLVMVFDIGELDFQASREGLSYIPETILAIKNKLEKLNERLTAHLAERADAIENKWERTDYLVKMSQDYLWMNAVKQYVVDTQFELIDASNVRHHRISAIAFYKTPEELANDFNIVLRGFRMNYNNGCNTLAARNNWNATTQNYSVNWDIHVNDQVNFVINDTKIGALERAKYHWKNTKSTRVSDHRYSHSGDVVYVIEPADKSKLVDTDGFFASIYNPPANRIHKASSLLAKENTRTVSRNVTILSLQRRESYSRRDGGMVWRDAGKSNQFDSNTTYYYLPLSGYNSQGAVTDVKEFYNQVVDSGLLGTVTIYGVRKADLEWSKAQKNWVNIDEALRKKLATLGTTDVMGMVKSAIDFDSLYRHNATTLVDSKSPYVELYNEFKDIKSKKETVQRAIKSLCIAYQVGTKQIVDPTVLIAKYKTKVQDILKRYPLLDNLSGYGRVEVTAVAEYINAIDIIKAK